MFPKDNPQIIIYGAVKRPDYGSSAALSTAIKKLISDVGKYLNINGEKINTEVSDINYVVPNLINKSIDTVTSINHAKIIIGDGNKVIDQYPKANTVINDDDKIFILTNGKNINLENMKMWSSREVTTYCNLINIKCNIEGYGYVSSQDIAPGTNIFNVTEVNIVLDRTSDKVKVGS
jgi:penicillin-binding protein 2B